VNATTTEQVLLIVAGVTGCVNTALQIARSVYRRKETRERRLLEQFLYEHANNEERATKRIEAKHEELVSEVRAMTPIAVKPVGVPKE